MTTKRTSKFTPLKVPGMKQSEKNSIHYLDAHSVKMGAILRDLTDRVKYHGYSSKWVGASQAECQRMLDKGAEKQVAAARKFAKEVEREIPVITPAMRMTNVVAGGSVSVGRALAGNPVCFTRPAFDNSASNPVRIV